MNVPQELETLRDWLRFAVSRFNAGGLCRSATASPTRTTRRPTCCCMRCICRSTALEPFLDAKLTHAERNELAALLDAPHRRARSRRLPDARGVARRVPLPRRRARASFRARSSPSCCRTASRRYVVDPPRSSRRSTFAPAPAASPCCSRTRSRTADIDAVDICRRTRSPSRSATSATTASPAAST